MAISRLDTLKSLMPRLQELFGEKHTVYKIIYRKGKYSLKEETYLGGYKTEMKIIAKDLTKDEALALRRITTGKE